MIYAVAAVMVSLFPGLKGKVMRLGALAIMITSGFLLSTVTALAQTAPSDPNSTSPAGTASPAAAPINNDDLVTCRYEKTTGSNFARRVCHTQREWHQMTLDARDTMERLDNGTHGGPLTGGN
ncbi:MAG TPA: hypothetical protein VMU08_10575 [Rhizomicrobium sp.]|nr:hypothetical protein [Rhizomicrobium sp.]